jgi:hypothetical protein
MTPLISKKDVPESVSLPKKFHIVPLDSSTTWYMLVAH